MKPLFDRYHRYSSLALAAIVIVSLLAGCSQASSRAPSSMESIHAGYLDLSANLTDLRSRITAWQNGDEASLKIAQEKLDRTQVILTAIGWPQAMAPAIAKTSAAVAPMASVIKDKDLATADAASKAFGDASHDVTHAFYGDYLPSPEAASYGRMAPHVIYLDLSANLADLQTRVGQWQKGDESSLTIAKEKADRIGGLLLHLAPTGVLAKRVQTLQTNLAAMSVALAGADKGAAQQAIVPLAAASADLTRDAYAWMDLVVVTGKDDACTQASYLDLSRNIADLRTGVGEWQKGNSASLGTAQEKLARARLLLDHARWPEAMWAATDKTQAAVVAMAQALETKNAAAVEAASQGLSDASHDVTHAFYGDWLPGAQTASTQVVAPGAQGASAAAAASSDGHMHSGSSVAGTAVANGPDWTIIGGFAAALALVIGLAAVTKPKRSTARQTASPDGSQA